MSARRLLGVIVAGALVAACGGPRPPPPAQPVELAPSAPLPYAFEALDGRPVSTDAFLHRVTVIAMLTTYDVPSQVQARFLEELARRHTPRLNVAALMLEAPENKPIVEAFVASLGVRYPVALADAATIAGEGPFAGLHHVPSVVILDRRGREVFRHAGLMTKAALDAAVRQVEAGP